MSYEKLVKKLSQKQKKRTEQQKIGPTPDTMRTMVSKTGRVITVSITKVAIDPKEDGASPDSLDPEYQMHDPLESDDY